MSFGCNGIINNLLFLKGMLDITKDMCFANVYDNLPVELPGDVELAEERKFFMNHVDHLTMLMTIFNKSIQQHSNMFVLDNDWLISSIIQATEDKIDSVGYERLNARLQLHEIMLKVSYYFVYLQCTE